jgi:hypothetical protein
MHAKPCHECGKPGTIFDGNPVVWFCHGCYARALNGGNAPEPPAPNAANAAPLMPVCDACSGSGMSRMVWENTDGQCAVCNGTGRLRGTREGFPAIIRPGHLGADESLPAYAWPGGYPLAYYPCTYSPPFDKILNDGTPYHADEHAETVGDVLCPDCAAADLHADDPDDDMCFIALIVEEVSDSNLTCDQCSAVIAYQNYCHDCGESVDCDEEHPYHLCPKTEPYTVRYLTHCPGSDWKTYPKTAEGPDDARRIAKNFLPEAAFVHVQPSRLDFPPVIEEED